jgi:hypothetical protein
MMRFNVRVELLNGASAQDYENLHARMMVNAYAPFIVGDDGVKYELPPAEYVHVSDLELRMVRDRASAIIARGLRAGLQYRLYVLPFADWAGVNLEPTP